MTSPPHIIDRDPVGCAATYAPTPWRVVPRDEYVGAVMDAFNGTVVIGYLGICERIVAAVNAIEPGGRALE